MKKDLNKIYEKRAKRFLILALILIVGFVLWVLTYEEKPPVLFPLDDAQASYTIEKEDIFYSIHYKSISDKNKSYDCPAGFDLFGFNSGKCKEIVESDVTVYVGESNIDLSSLEGRGVKISGRFVFSDKQCIASKCILLSKFNNKYVAINIYNIRENLIDFVDQRPRDKIISYTVGTGDTLQTVSDKFIISIDTIKWENNLVSDSIIAGQHLNILPVSGVAHTVVAGDTIESLAQKYSTNKQKIIDYPFNNYADPEKFTLISGEILIIPDGKK